MRRVIRYAEAVVIIIMGAAGASTSTIGRALAAELGWTFVDTDDLHPPPNVETSGASLRAIVAHALDRRESLVLACPPLSERNREALRAGLHPVRFVFLEAMPALDEPPFDESLHVDAARPPERILAAIRTEFGV
jgi:gluconokinase